MAAEDLHRSADDRISAELAAIGDHIGVLDISFHAGARLWTLFVDERLTVLLELDEMRDVLTLSSELGEPALGLSLELLELTMLFNSQWKSNGGFRICRLGTGSDFSLALELATSCLTSDRFSPAIAAFSRVFHAWKEVLAKFRAEGEKFSLNDHDFGSIIIRG